MFRYTIAILFVLLWGMIVNAQRLTDTPVPVVIPDVQQQPTSVQLFTPTTTLSPIPDVPEVLLEAVDAPANINVRDFPDPTGNRLGSMQPDTQYRVTGRFFSWYQFEYETSPNGVAWVFGTLVRIIGDEGLIPDIDPNVAPTQDSPEALGTSTAEALLLTPGVANTATAQARELALPTNELGSGANQDFPPTFTPPPNVAQRRPTVDVSVKLSPTPQGDLLERSVELITDTNVAPIVPILALFGLGVLGLLISSIRR